MPKIANKEIKKQEFKQLEQVLTNCGPQAKCVFENKSAFIIKLQQDMSTPTHLPFAYVGFWLQAELNSCSRDCMVHKAEKTTMWPFTEKVNP